MPICPQCQRESSELLAPCPSSKHDLYCIEEEEYYAQKTDPLLGHKVAGRYIVRAVLGRGSMARVYRAHQDQVDRSVALKVFRLETILGQQEGAHTTDDEREQAKQQFVREAKVLGQLSHPNCVTVYDFGAEQDGSFLYIAMEFVAGSDLRGALQRGPKLDAIVEISRQLLGALREAHSLNIVHRDLKPENVILSYRSSRGGHVIKILDFGIAKLLADTDHDDGGSQLFGTPAYMSPEQCRGDVESVGPPADVYAFGCMLYEMLCGRLPYPADSARGMVEAHQTADIPALEPRPNLDVPDPLATMTRMCLQKDPHDRYQTGGDALNALEEAVSRTDLSLGISSAVSPETGGTVDPKRDVVVPDNRVSGAELDPIGGESGEPRRDEAPDDSRQEEASEEMDSVPETKIVAIEHEHEPPPESTELDARPAESPQFDESGSDDKQTIPISDPQSATDTLDHGALGSSDGEEMSLLDELNPYVVAAVGTVFVVAISVVAMFYIIVTSI